jgi:hypothetical protein
VRSRWVIIAGSVPDYAALSALGVSGRDCVAILPAVSLFARAPKPIEYRILKDQAWSDPELDGLYTASRNISYPAGYRVGRVLQHLAAVRADAERRTAAVHAVAEPLISCLDEVRSAAAAAGPDPRARADALALLAQVLVAAAWEVRGGGRASTVTADAARVFHQILEEADEVGYRALELDDGNPIAAVARLTSGRGLGLVNDEWRARFAVARQVRPTLYLAHTQMLQALCAKWYGSAERMFDFARRTAEQAPVGDPVGAVLAIAHVENLLETRRLVVPAADLVLARHASDRWVAGGEAAMAAHPSAPVAHQLFGWLLRADKERSRFHLSRTMGRIAFLPWSYLEGGEVTFRQMLSDRKVPNWADRGADKVVRHEPDTSTDR